MANVNFHITEEDFAFEEDLLRNPYQPKSWLRYLDHKRASTTGSVEGLWFLYERAVKELPGSYKLWKRYLDERCEHLLTSLRHSSEDTTSPASVLKELAAVNGVFERALVYLNRMPHIWLDYAAWLMRQRKITKARRTLDRALRSLPLTQHERVWEAYKRFGKVIAKVCPETTVSIWKRWWQVAPRNGKTAAAFLDVLLGCGKYDEAAKQLVNWAQDEQRQFAESPETLLDQGMVAAVGAAAGRNAEAPPEDLYRRESGEEDATNPGAFWEKLCQLIVEHGEEITSVPVERVMRTAIVASTQATLVALSNVASGNRRKQVRNTGVLWTALATYQIKCGRFEAARDVYEEGLRSVPTVRDFGLVFDAYAKFEETLLAVELDRKARSTRSGEEDEVDLRLARFERLMDRRPFLVSDVNLRQQPNSVDEWIRRIDLVIKGPARSQDEHVRHDEQIVKVFKEALKTIHPRRAKGKNSLASLWIRFALFYEELGKATGQLEKALEQADLVFEEAVKADYASVDELVEVWLGWVELQMRNNQKEKALDLLGRATLPPPSAKRRAESEEKPHQAQLQLFKSVRLWNYFIDFEESRGFKGSIKAAYERVLELGLATPQTIVNYAIFVEEAFGEEEAFRIYERGIAMFGWPAAFELWNIYLPNFVTCYSKDARHRGGGKLERIRDLFEQALRGCPPKYAKDVYLMYAKVEETFGLAGSALRVLGRATETVAPEDRLAIYELLIAKTVDSAAGLLGTRPIYEAALTRLPDADAITMAIRFALKVEASLGEVERARAILAHASQLADPRTCPRLWEAWHKFEVERGSEDTFREMLRVKRAVQAKFVTQMPFVPAASVAPPTHHMAAEGTEAGGNEEEIKLE